MFRNLIYVSLSYGYIYILGYIFHFYVSRKLGPAGYGEFMVLYSLMMTVGNLTSLLGTVSIKGVVENMHHKEEILRYLRLFAIVLGVMVASTGAILSPLIADFLRITDLTYLWFISLAWLFMFPVAVERGYLQAQERFGVVALQSSGELTLRLLLAIFFLQVGLGISGALLPSTLSILTSFLVLLLVNNSFLGKLRKISFRYMFKIVLYASPSGFFTYADDIFIRRIFDEHTAGLFASVSIVGKAFIWLSMTLFGVFFPRLIAVKENVDKFRKFSLLAVLMITSIFLLGDLLLILIGERIFLFLFGDKFHEAFDYLPYYVISVYPLSISLAFIGISVAVERNLKLIYLHLFAFYTGFLLLDFDGIQDYMLYIFILNSTFSVIYVWILLRGRLKSA